MSVTLIFSSIVFFNIFNIEWFYQGMEEYGYIAIRSFIIKCISLILLFLMVKNDNDIEIYAGILCFGTIGNYFLNIINLKKYVNFTFKNLDVKRHIKPILIFFASVIAIELYSLLDVTMLTEMAPIESVGYYNNASKVVKTIVNSITAFGAVLMPRLSLYYSEKNTKQIKNDLSLFLKVITMFTFPAAVGILLTSEEIVMLLFVRVFYSSIITLKILSLLIILMPLSGGIFGQLLLTIGDEKKYFICVFFGAAINFILNFILIRKYLENGAAVASIITEFCVVILMIFMSIKKIKLKFDYKYYLKIFFGIGIMSIFCIVFDNFNLQIGYLIKFLIKVVVSILIYFIVLFLLKNEIIMSIFNKKRKCNKISDE